MLNLAQFGTHILRGAAAGRSRRYRSSMQRAMLRFFVGINSQ